MDDTRDNPSAWPEPESVGPDPAAAKPTERRWLPTFFGGLATGGMSVLLLVSVALVSSGLLFDEGGRINPPAEPSATVTVVPSQDPASETGVELMMHPGTRCAWPVLGLPWEAMHSDWDRDELLNPVGQAIVLSERWVAPFFVGQLNEEHVEYDGPDGLKDSAKSLSESLIDRYYNDADGRTLKGLDKGSVSTWKHTFDGHEGIVTQRTVSWDEPQAGETSETQIVAVIDVDGDRAVGVEITLPKSQKDQYLIALETLFAFRFMD